MVAVPIGAPVGVGALVVDDVVVEGVCDDVVAVAEVVVADSATVGLPVVVEHPADTPTMTARASTARTAER